MKSKISEAVTATPAATVDDVAAYIVGEANHALGRLSAMKLHRLLHYCQAWSLVWEGRPMFGEPIHAWAAGPVVPSIYAKHRGEFQIGSWNDGDPTALDASARATADAVIRFYGPRNVQWLNDLARNEAPCRDAAATRRPGEEPSAEIPLAALAAYHADVYHSDPWPAAAAPLARLLEGLRRLRVRCTRASR